MKRDEIIELIEEVTEDKASFDEVSMAVGEVYDKIDALAKHLGVRFEYHEAGCVVTTREEA